MKRSEPEADEEKESLERELRLMLSHVAGEDAEQMYEQLRRVADPETLVAYLRDLRLPSRAELSGMLARSMAEGLGKREAQAKQLAEMLEGYRSRQDMHVMLDAQIESLAAAIRGCLKDGEYVEGVVTPGKNMIMRNGNFVEIGWKKGIACDLCTGDMLAGVRIYYCAVRQRWQAADGTVEDGGGVGICAGCRRLLEEREELRFPDYVLLVYRRIAVGV